MDLAEVGLTRVQIRQLQRLSQGATRRDSQGEGKNMCYYGYLKHIITTIVIYYKVMYSYFIVPFLLLLSLESLLFLALVLFLFC